MGGRGREASYWTGRMNVIGVGLDALESDWLSIWVKDQRRGRRQICSNSSSEKHLVANRCKLKFNKATTSKTQHKQWALNGIYCCRCNWWISWPPVGVKTELKHLKSSFLLIRSEIYSDMRFTPHNLLTATLQSLWWELLSPGKRQKSFTVVQNFPFLFPEWHHLLCVVKTDLIRLT